MHFILLFVFSHAAISFCFWFFVFCAFCFSSVHCSVFCLSSLAMKLGLQSSRQAVWMAKISLLDGWTMGPPLWSSLKYQRIVKGFALESRLCKTQFQDHVAKIKDPLCVTFFDCYSILRASTFFTDWNISTATIGWIAIKFSSDRRQSDVSQTMTDWLCGSHLLSGLSWNLIQIFRSPQDTLYKMQILKNECLFSSSSVVLCV